ncbi:hypothetical protein BD414DRAFT_531780 [Trametes punicea]|nr:hypothetical protein BD414DRAFT_531780 [Trametes punicea]
MATLASHALSCGSLLKAVEELSQQRFSMSVEELHIVKRALHSTMALFCEASNAYSCISKLPPEILIRIFSMVPDTLPSSGTWGSSARRTYDLVPLTHVCRRWRAIALHASSLWTTICETTYTHNASKAFWARARQSPLTIYVDRPYPTEALTALLATDGEAIAELNLHGLEDLSPTRIVSELLAFPAPCLERVVVHSQSMRGDPIDSAVDSNHLVQLWRGVAPELKSIEFHDVPFLPANEFGKLRYLTLSYDNCSVDWTLGDLLHFISNTPALEGIHLRGLPADLHLRAPLEASPVSLPCLKTMELGDCRGYSSPIPLLHLLLSHIVGPTDAFVRIYGVEAYRLSSPLSLWPITEDWSKLDIEMSWSTLALTLSRSSSRPGFCLELNTGGAAKGLVEGAIRACIGDNTKLWPRYVSITSQRCWWTWCDPTLLLSLLPRLEVLELQDRHLVSDALNALRPSTMNESTPGHHEVPCRNLTTLRIPSLLNSSVVQHLSTVLNERASCGLRLKRLETISLDDVSPDVGSAPSEDALALIDVVESICQGELSRADIPRRTLSVNPCRRITTSAPFSPVTLSQLGYIAMADY